MLPLVICADFTPSNKIIDPGTDRHSGKIQRCKHLCMETMCLKVKA